MFIYTDKKYVCAALVLALNTFVGLRVVYAEFVVTKIWETKELPGGNSGLRAGSHDRLFLGGIGLNDQELIVTDGC